MPALYKVDMRGIEGVQQNIRYVRESFPQWAADANEKTAKDIQQLAQRTITTIDAIATGKMYAGIETSSSKAGLVWAVGSKAEYAPFVELGTRPHFPPISAIREWCRVRGIPESAAYAICLKIAKLGTPERPFLFPAFYLGIRNHIARMREQVVGGLRKKLG
jgi:hypothetical protein